jgi:hypothetical protein
LGILYLKVRTGVIHAAMAKGEKIMTLRALTLSGVAGLLFAAVSVSSEPALAQCGGCYAPAPVVVQPYVQSCGCCSCGGGAAYYGAGYAYGGYYGVGGPHTPWIMGMATTAMVIVPASDFAGDGAAIEHDQSTFSCGMI